MQYSNHANPKVKNVIQAQQIMMARAGLLRMESYRLPWKRDRERARDAAVKVERAAVYLSIELKHDPGCWIEG
jgi:hypothetical protein